MHVKYNTKQLMQ